MPGNVIVISVMEGDTFRVIHLMNYFNSHRTVVDVGNIKYASIDGRRLIVVAVGERRMLQVAECIQTCQ